MAIQYVSDDAGNPTAVLVPIKEWNSIVAKHEDVRVLILESTQPKSKKKPSDFAGTLSSEEADKFIKYVEESRNEWERTF